jgi:hypothetical protein
MKHNDHGYQYSFARNGPKCVVSGVRPRIRLRVLTNARRSSPMLRLSSTITAFFFYHLPFRLFLNPNVCCTIIVIIYFFFSITIIFNFIAFFSWLAPPCDSMIDCLFIPFLFPFAYLVFQPRVSIRFTTASNFLFASSDCQWHFISFLPFKFPSRPRTVLDECVRAFLHQSSYSSLSLPFHFPRSQFDSLCSLE